MTEARFRWLLSRCLTAVGNEIPPLAGLLCSPQYSNFCMESAPTSKPSMPPSLAALEHVYSILSEREAIRLGYSRPRPPPNYPSPQHIFYSVVNSLKYRTTNRYSNILAYDRTAIKVDNDGYLNANVVCDGKGSWWVASQVRS